MARTDKSVAILTGMIIAALYVILLIGASRESYMRRDATLRADADSSVSIVNDVSKRVCRIEGAICPESVVGTSAGQACAASVSAARQLVGGPIASVTPDGLWQAMRNHEQ